MILIKEIYRLTKNDFSIFMVGKLEIRPTDCTKTRTTDKPVQRRDRAVDSMPSLAAIFNLQTLQNVALIYLILIN